MLKNFIIERVPELDDTLSQAGIKEDNVRLVIFDFGTYQSAKYKFVGFKLFFFVLDVDIAEL